MDRYTELDAHTPSCTHRLGRDPEGLGCMAPLVQPTSVGTPGHPSARGPVDPRGPTGTASQEAAAHAARTPMAISWPEIANSPASFERNAPFRPSAARTIPEIGTNPAADRGSGSPRRGWSRIPGRAEPPDPGETPTARLVPLGLAFVELPGRDLREGTSAVHPIRLPTRNGDEPESLTRLPEAFHDAVMRRSMDQNRAEPRDAMRPSRGLGLRPGGALLWIPTLFGIACNPVASPPDPVERRATVEVTEARLFHDGWVKVGTIIPDQRGDGVIIAPAGTDFAPNGDLLVTDRSEHNLKLFDRSGALKAVIGEAGLADGQLTGPMRARFDPDGNISVYSRGSRMITVFSPDGEPLLSVSLPPDLPDPRDMMPLGAEGFLFAATVAGDPLGIELYCVGRDGELAFRSEVVPVDAAPLFWKHPPYSPPLARQFFVTWFAGSGDGWTLGHSLNATAMRGSGCDRPREVRTAASPNYLRLGEELDVSWWIEDGPSSREEHLAKVFERHFVGPPVLMGDIVLLPLSHGQVGMAPTVDVLQFAVPDGADSAVHWFQAPPIVGAVGDTLITLDVPFPYLPELVFGKWVRAGL